MASESVVRSRSTSNAGRREYIVYENEQRIVPMGDFTSFMIPGLQRPRFSDEQGNKKKPHKITLDAGWKWEEPEWRPWIQQGFTDAQGWTYAPSFLFGSWSQAPTAADFVRRRRLQRHAIMEASAAPYNSLGRDRSQSVGCFSAPSVSLAANTTSIPNDESKATEGIRSGEKDAATSTKAEITQPHSGQSARGRANMRPVSIHRDPDLGQGLVNELIMLFQSLAPLEKMLEKIGTDKDTVNFRRDLQTTLDETKQSGKEFKKQLDFFESKNRREQDPTKELENRKQISKLKRDFERFTSDFEKLSNRATELKQRAGPPVSVIRPKSIAQPLSQGKAGDFNPRMLNLQDDEIYHDTKQEEENELNLQQFSETAGYLEDEITVNERIIAERSEAIRQLEEAVMEVNEIFKDLAIHVESQGEKLAIIDANVSATLQNTDEALLELKRAQQFQKSLSLQSDSKVEAEEKQRRAERDKDLETARNARAALDDCREVFFYPRHALPGFVLWSTLGENDMFVYQKYRAKLWPYKYRILMKDGYMLLAAHMDKAKMDKAWAFLTQVQQENQENQTPIATSQFLSLIKRLKQDGR